MALMLKKRKDIPSDAVILSKHEALLYQDKLIRTWESTADVWSLRYGPGILGSMAVFSGFAINSHYRTKLKLGNYGKISSYIPIVALPAIMTSLYHNYIIQQKILLQTEKCPVCVEVQSALLQTGFGVVFPMILSPLSSFMFATKHFTYRLPNAFNQPKEVFKLWYKFTKPVSSKLFTLLSLNFMLAMFISYKEFDSFYELQLKLQKLEREYQEQE